MCHSSRALETFGGHLGSTRRSWLLHLAWLPLATTCKLYCRCIHTRFAWQTRPARVEDCSPPDRIYFPNRLHFICRSGKALAQNAVITRWSVECQHQQRRDCPEDGLQTSNEESLVREFSGLQPVRNLIISLASDRSLIRLSDCLVEFDLGPTSEIRPLTNVAMLARFASVHCCSPVWTFNASLVQGQIHAFHHSRPGERWTCC
jgi:hypothetical protein